MDLLEGISKKTDEKLWDELRTRNSKQSRKFKLVDQGPVKIFNATPNQFQSYPTVVVIEMEDEKSFLDSKFKGYNRQKIKTRKGKNNRTKAIKVLSGKFTKRTEKIRNKQSIISSDPSSSCQSEIYSIGSTVQTSCATTSDSDETESVISISFESDSTVSDSKDTTLIRIESNPSFNHSVSQGHSNLSSQLSAGSTRASSRRKSVWFDSTLEFSTDTVCVTSGDEFY